MSEPANDFKLSAGPTPKPPKVREADVLAQIRELLRRLKVPHWKNWGGPMGERGVPDLIGVIPGGQLLLIEVKGPGGQVSPEQAAFIERYGAAGALAFVARDPMEVLARLAGIGYEPAMTALGQFRQPRGVPGATQ